MRNRLCQLRDCFKYKQRKYYQIYRMNEEKNKAKVTHLPSVVENKPKTSLSGIDEHRKYKIGAFLGSGGFAECFRATQVFSNREYAVKIVNKRSENMTKNGANDRLKNEIQIMRRLKHQNILRLVEKFEDEFNHYLVLELCNKLSLSEMLRRKGRFKELEVKYFIRQLVMAAIYLKEMHILHRDIKTPNILLDDNLVVKLADFGLAILADTTDLRAYGCCGTPSYMAPEVTRIGKEQHVRYSYQADMWSIGVVTYVLLFSSHPFYSASVKKGLKKEEDQKNHQTKIYQNIRNLRYPSLARSNVSAAAKDFISKIFVIDPKYRMNIEQAISHQFLTESIPAQLPASWDLKEVNYSDILPLCKNVNPPACRPQKGRPSDATELKNRSITSYFTDKNLFKSGRKEAKPEKTKEKKEKVEPFEIKIDQHQQPIQQNIANKQPQNEIIEADIERTVAKNYIQQEQSVDESVADILNDDFGQNQWLQQKLLKWPYIVEFRDLSQRYGICFHLSNGVKGIFFNDKTSIAIDNVSKDVIYVQPASKKLLQCERMLYKLVLVQTSDQNGSKCNTNGEKYVLRRYNPNYLPVKADQNPDKKDNNEFKVTSFKAFDLPNNQNIIRKYFFLKEYTRSLNQDEQQWSESQVDLFKCATLIRKWGYRTKSRQYLFKTSAYIQAIFPDGNYYFLPRKTDELIIWNHEAKIRKSAILPLRNTKQLTKKQAQQVEIIHKLMKNFTKKSKQGQRNV